MRLGEMLWKFWPKNAWLQAFGCVGISLAAIGIFSWLTGLAGQVCTANEKGGDPDCHSYNLAYAILLQGLVWLNDLSVIITAVATALLTYVTVLLWRIEREGGDTTRAQLRAYVCVNITGINKVVEGGTPVAQFSVVNTGQTPAYEMYVMSNMVVTRFPYPHELGLGPPWLRVSTEGVTFPRMSVGFLGASQHVWRREELNIPLSPEVMDSLKKKTHAIFVYGNVRYRDAFGTYWDLEFRYVCGGEADLNALYMDKTEEKRGSESDHKGALRMAGHSFRFGEPPEDKRPLAPLSGE